MGKIGDTISYILIPLDSNTRPWRYILCNQNLRYFSVRYFVEIN